MGKITVLDAHIANQIAAGEVVERPASIVKELIENSIDAGSTNIEINIKEGGLAYIKIKDNGEGMDREDATKAFLRHATSKMLDTRDLFQIKTLGFRGEALPSIAAISRLTLRTSSENSGRGIEIKLEGGKVINQHEIAYNKGTEIIVEDIFYNTPARLKYMKTLQTELGHITDYVNRLCLSFPQISFSLIHNDRLVLRTNGNGELLHSISAIYGTSIAKSMIQLKTENLDFVLSGYLSKPEITRANKNHISIYVNGRYVKNYLLAQTVIKGYNTLLMVNRFPITVLHLKMDPALVDVNVHPAKLEVRFSKEQELLKFIENSIADTLNIQSFVREPLKSDKPQIKYQKPDQSNLDLGIYLPAKEIVNTTNNTNSSFKDNAFVSEPIEVNEKFETKIKSENHENSEKKGNKTNQIKLPPLEPIAQYQGTYIIAQNETGLYLIDQHAAHERIYFEENINLSAKEIIVSQELLVPFTLDYPKSEVEQIINRLELLKNHGINIELFGQQTFIVRSIPQWIPNGKEAEYIDKMIQMLISSGEIKLNDIRQDLIASLSCKTAIKANHYMTKREMEILLEQLRKTENPFSCPHGRPIIIHFSNYEIEKMFKRVV